MRDLGEVPTGMPREGDVEVDGEDGGKKKKKKRKMNKEPVGRDVSGDKAKLKAWLSF